MGIRYTADEVVVMNNYQMTSFCHPYTCPNRGDGNHRVWNGDLGALVATVGGWICIWCDYVQENTDAGIFRIVKEIEKMDTAGIAKEKGNG